MKLFYSPFHHFVHKVLVVAYEAGVADTLERVPTFPFRNCDGEWVAGQYDISMLNPLAKVPFVTLDDGTALYSSQVIVEYLDSLSEGKKLYPEGGQERFDALRRLALGDAVFEFAVQMVMEGWRESGDQRADLYGWLWPKVTRSFDQAERDSANRRDFDIGDVGMLQGLSFVDSWASGNDDIPGNPCIEWRDRWPGLAEWFSLASDRPSVDWHYNKPYGGDMSAAYHAAAVAEVLELQAARR